MEQSHHRSIGVLAAMGGALMTLSMFFRLSYGPFGGEVSYYRLISGYLTWNSWPMLLVAWPVAFGVLETAFNLAHVGGRLPVTILKWHVIAVGTLLLLVACLQLWLFVRQTPFEQTPSHALLPLISAVGSLVAVVVVVIRTSVPEKRLQWLRIISITWILIGLFPVSSGVPVSDLFRVYGAGYWMLISGTLIVAVAAVLQLRARGGGSLEIAKPLE